MCNRLAAGDTCSINAKETSGFKSISVGKMSGSSPRLKGTSSLAVTEVVSIKKSLGGSPG